MGHQGATAGDTEPGTLLEPPKEYFGKRVTVFQAMPQREP